MQTLDLVRRRLAIGLAALAGFVDASGFLAANRYFVSFMSGNTTRLGVDLVTLPRLAWIPAFLILAFVTGVVGGALLSTAAGVNRKAGVLWSVTALLGAAACLHALGFVIETLGVLAVAMGALNNVFQRNGEVSVGLTYMTGALVRLGQGVAARLSGRGGEGWQGWLMLWLSLSIGAVAGAVAWTQAPALALWLATGWTALLSFSARRLSAA